MLNTSVYYKWQHKEGVEDIFLIVTPLVVSSYKAATMAAALCCLVTFIAKDSRALFTPTRIFFG